MSDFDPTYMHMKTKTPYQVVIRRAHNESDMSLVTVYRNKEGIHFVRPFAEFFDGRFILMEDF